MVVGSLVQPGAVTSREADIRISQTPGVAADIPETGLQPIQIISRDQFSPVCRTNMINPSRMMIFRSNIIPAVYVVFERKLNLIRRGCMIPYIWAVVNPCSSIESSRQGAGAFRHYLTEGDRSAMSFIRFHSNRLSLIS